MKLLLCRECLDIISIHLDVERVCKCGKTGGKYIDKLNAVYFGDMAVPIGFVNNSLMKAIHRQPQIGMGEEFTAFVIPVNCISFKKIIQ